MSLSQTPPIALAERLLSEAVVRHELSSSAVPAIHDLLRHGLSFEQALVGTGLIPFQTFTDWMREASGLPVVVSVSSGELLELPPGLDEAMVLGWSVIPEKVSSKKWQIGLTNPWDHDARSALESLAVEQGWQLEFAYVPRSLADTWFQKLKQRSALSSQDRNLAAFTRQLLAQLTPGTTLVIQASGQPINPRETTLYAPAAWLSALKLRLHRQLQGSQAILETHGHGQRLRLRITHPQAVSAPDQSVEHPVHDWSTTLREAFTQAVLVFLFDPNSDLLTRPSLADLHVPYEERMSWQPGKRWASVASPVIQEELFHLSLAGYPGTVQFASRETLNDWEAQAKQYELPVLVCVGQPTPHGVAWSVYPL